MSLHTLDEIEDAIKDLPPDKRETLLSRLASSDLDAFEQKIADDFRAGKLDDLLREASEEHRAGRTRPL